MPRPGRISKIEKPRQLGGSLKRLIKELNIFKFLIIISIVLAIAGSFLSIVTPNRLSDMVNEISGGMMPRMDEIKPVIENAMNGIKTKKIEPITIDGVMVSKKDQMELLGLLKEFQNEKGMKELSREEQIQSLKKLDNLPQSIKKIIEPKMNLKKVRDIGLFVFLLYALSSLFTYIQSIINANVSNKFAKNLRKRIATKINRLPLSFFDNMTVGDILSRVTNDVDTISESMNQSLSNLISSTVLILGTIIMMFKTNWQMALTAILSSFIGFVLMFMIIGKSQKYFSLRQSSLGKLNGHIEEIYSGLNIVKVYNAREQVQNKFETLNKEVYTANKMSQFLSGLIMPLMMFVGNLGYVAVCVVGAILTIKGKISFGVIVAFISYVRLFTAPLAQLGQAMNLVQAAAASSERVFEFLDAKEMNTEEDKTDYLDPKNANGLIEFKDVRFTYEGNTKPTIEDFSKVIKPGEKVAIVGPTGAGKTTMVNLLMKFYEIDGGDIIIDGKSIHNLTRKNVHSLFTMVLQDAWLFNGTIRENIIFNRENVSEERLKKVIEAVGLHHFVNTLPNGIDSKIDDSDSVSQGQRQLLTIARAMVDDKPFLILDEATSNVDTRSEELVQKAMDKLTVGRTSFIIAHRLSTIKNADVILVMKDGNIIEEGNHEELIEKGGFYADLYNSQFSL